MLCLEELIFIDKKYAEEEGENRIVWVSELER